MINHYDVCDTKLEFNTTTKTLYIVSSDGGCAIIEGENVVELYYKLQEIIENENI